MSLRRKKITVRGKSGKIFQRSVMVRAEAIGKNSNGKRLNSLNPWEVHHVEGVNTNTRLGERQKAYGSSGPGSSHSVFALALAAEIARHRLSADKRHGITETLSGTAMHAEARQVTARNAAFCVQGGLNREPPRVPSAQRATELATAFGVPKSHVRRNFQGARFPGNW